MCALGLRVCWRAAHPLHPSPSSPPTRPLRPGPGAPRGSHPGPPAPAEPAPRGCGPLRRNGHAPRALSWYHSRRESVMRFDRITVDPRRMNGQPCVRDLRITVRRVLEILATYPDRATIRQEYPELEDEDI